MPDIPKAIPHKLGDNRNELARRLRKRDPNFAQSRDIREDRGERQIKMVRRRQTMPHVIQAAKPNR